MLAQAQYGQLWSASFAERQQVFRQYFSIHNRYSLKQSPFPQCLHSVFKSIQPANFLMFIAFFPVYMDSSI